MKPDPVAAFVSAINQRNPQRLGELMTDNHRFVDSMGGEVVGRAKTVAGWTAYFALFPDYEVFVDQRFADGDSVALFGRTRAVHSASGREVRMRAAWLAKVKGNQVAEWSVYADNEPARAALEGR